MGFEVEKTDEQWRQELAEFEYHVLREKGTELHAATVVGDSIEDATEYWLSIVRMA